MSKKLIRSVLGISIIFFLVWYFGFKKSDYSFQLKANTATGTMYQGVLEWFESNKKTNDLQYKITHQELNSKLTIETYKNNKTIVYQWFFETENDSITSISIDISEKGKGFYNKITVPFFSTEFKTNQKEMIDSFKEGIKSHLATHRVKFDGEKTSTAVFVAYIHLQSNQEEKAQTMIMNDHHITTYLREKNVKIVGTPYLEILHWDKANKKLDFNYCFPIDTKSVYIQDSKIKFKWIPATKGLSATYYGNYRTSDRAWFRIEDFAKRNNINLENKVIEHFFANPFNGGNELEWKTEVVIPTKN